MKNTLKGVLLSGLVFPGLGQIAQKSYRRGVFLMLAVAVGVVAMTTVAVKQAGVIFHQIETDGGVIDIEAITDAVDRIANTTDSAIIDGALLLIVVLWITGVIDAYRTGRKLDSAGRAQRAVSSRRGC